MFDRLRQSLDELIAARTRPEERRAAAARMKDTLVLARLGLEDLRKGVEQTRARLAAERRELETVVRRKTLAAGIADAQTVTVAERFERQHAERVAVLERKLEAQEQELAIAERDVRDMTDELRAAISGAPPPGASPVGGPVDDAPPADDPRDDDALTDSIDALGRQRAREEREARAAARLDELKRRMGR